MKNKLKPYPEYICRFCARLPKKQSYLVHYGTYHWDECDVCKKIAYVTQPKEYGNPKLKGFEKP